MKPKRMGHPVYVGPPVLRHMSFWCRGGCGFDWVVLAREVGGGLDVGGGGIFGLLDLDAKYVTWTEHITGEEDEFFVWREADVRFGAVVVVRHVDEVLGLEEAWLPEGGFVERAFCIADHRWVKELDPFAVRGLGDLAGVAA